MIYLSKVLITMAVLLAAFSQAHAELNVAVTITPLGEFVDAVSGEKANVTVMVPPGADPHTYEPTPGQMRRVSESELYVKVGSGIEFETAWLSRLLAVNPQIVLCDASEGIELISGKGHGHGSGEDPHIWLSPVNAAIMVENVRDAFMELDPERAEIYERNASSYIEELRKLHVYIKESLAGIEERTLMVLHPAWGYYAREYDLSQVAVEHEGKTPSPRKLAETVLKARREGVGAVFVSPQFDPKSAETVAREISGRTAVIDPMGPGYIDNLRTVTDKIVSSKN